MSEESADSSAADASTRWNIKRNLKDILLKLTHNEGLTPARLQQTSSWSWLKAKLGVSNAQEACQLIRVTLDALENDKNVEALRHLLGGEGYASSLKERREQYAKSVNRSESAINARAKEGVWLLADQLLITIEARTSVEPQSQIALVTALIGVQQALIAQTAVLTEINNRLKRLGD